MVWSVYAPTTRRFGALAGRYSGASAEATVGAGLGANVLIGGSNRTVTLQPVSVQGQAGLNLALGVAGAGTASGAIISPNDDKSGGRLFGRPLLMVRAAAGYIRLW